MAVAWLQVLDIDAINVADTQNIPLDHEFMPPRNYTLCTVKVKNGYIMFTVIHQD